MSMGKFDVYLRFKTLLLWNVQIHSILILSLVIIWRIFRALVGGIFRNDITLCVNSIAFNRKKGIELFLWLNEDQIRSIGYCWKRNSQRIISFIEKICFALGLPIRRCHLLLLTKTVQSTQKNLCKMFKQVISPRKIILDFWTLESQYN